MKMDLSRFRDTFLNESGEHIAAIESGLEQLKSAGGDQKPLQRVIQAVHALKGGAGAFGLADVVKFTDLVETVLERVRENRLELNADLISLLCRAKDALKELISKRDGGLPVGLDEIQQALKTAAPSLASTNQLFSRPTRAELSQVLADSVAAKRNTVSVPQSSSAPLPAEKPVPTEKIDKLFDLVSQLAISYSITERLMENFSSEALTRLQESIGSLECQVRELHERTAAVRLLPVGTLFSRFYRLVHDLAAQTGKRVKLVTDGEETEVDRSVLELLTDSLTHLLHNAAANGSEQEADRIRAGKNPERVIFLRAYEVGGSIVIEVRDEGAGLNLSEDGAGMDVMKRDIASLNGTISVDRQAGSGTVMRIQLPVTLAVLDGMVVRVEGQRFIIPLTSILETICIQPAQIKSVTGQGEVILIGEEDIPLLMLNRVFGLIPPVSQQNAPADDDVIRRLLGREIKLGDRRLLVVVVEHGKQRAALKVDELLGQQQILVKNLERNFGRVDGAVGATVLSDGRPALILDVPALLERSNPAAVTTARDDPNGRERLGSPATPSSSR